MPEDHDGITEPENSDTTLAKILGDALARDWEGRRPPESASPEDEDALPGAVPREPGGSGRVGNDIETTPAEPDEGFDAVMEAVLQSIGDIDLEAQWRAFHAEVTGAIHAETVEAIRSGFLRALEDGTVTLPAGAADALRPKNDLPRVEAAFEYRADSDDLPEPTIVVGDAADGPVTIELEGPASTVEPDKYFDGVPPMVADQLRDSAYNPGPGSIPIDLLDRLAPTEPTEWVVTTPDDNAERPATSIFGAIDRELAAEAATERSARAPGRRVPIWVWPAAAAAVIAIAAFLAFSGGDDEPDASVGSGGAVSPVSTATTTTGGVATVAPTTLATATPAAARTPQAVQIPTLRICPDGSSFSGYEQPDGSFLDAETGEERVCPPPPN